MVSLVAILMTVAAGAASYFYHSASISTTLYTRVEGAVESGDLESQQQWLRRYLMLQPDDADAIIQLAIAADQAAEEAMRDKRGQAIDKARQQLGSCIARLGEYEGLESSISDLRSRLIERLLQLGGVWCVEAERQIILLDAPQDDAQTAKRLALAVVGQWAADGYKERKPYLETDEVDAWTRISHLPIGEVLLLALSRNPGDLDLVGPYLQLLRSNPELFDSSTESVEKHQLKVDEIVADLLPRNDGRAQLLLYYYVLGGEEPGRANEVLLAAAPKASGRLKEISAESQDTDDFFEFPDFAWDVQLLAIAAEKVELLEPETAAAWYDQLMVVESERLNAELVETIFARAGFMRLRKDDMDGAIEVWERGMEVLGSSCVGLSGLIATSKLYNDEDQKASDAVENFKEAVQTLQVTYSKIGVWQKERRGRVGRQLQVAEWRLDVAEGLLARRQGDESTATEFLSEAFHSSVNAPEDERVRIGMLLADMAARNELWDRAATLLAECLELQPGNSLIRVRAAKAWDRAGHQTRAMRLWRVLSQTDSLQSKFISLQATFANECRKPPADMDFSGVRSVLGELESQLEGVAEPAGDSAQKSALETLAKQQASLRVQLPPPGVAYQDHLKSPEYVESLLALAKAHPNDVGLQAFATRQLMIAGSVDEAKKVLAGIAQMLGEEKTEYVAIAAELEYRSGNPNAASERLEKQADLDSDDSAKLLRSASLFAQVARDMERSYRLLAKIAESERSQMDLFKLANFSRALPLNSSLLSRDGKTISRDELSKYWEDQIRTKTGDDAAYAKWLEATALIDLLLQDRNELDPFDPRSRKARLLINQILKQRPRWGLAVSLEGWILAAEKRHDEAVDQLRVGISAGDKSQKTRMLLLRQLIAAGREEEAEVEMAALPQASLESLDPFGAMRIRVSGGVGDFDKMIEIARAGVSERPDDVLTQVVLARSLMAVAKRDLDNRRELLSEARRVIDKASELAGGDNLNTFLFRIQLASLEVTTNGFSGLQKELTELQEEIETSSLEQHSKYLLKSDCFAAVLEFSEAAEMLRLADKLKPDAEKQVKLAYLYRKMQDVDAEVNALRKAQRRDPDNAALRARLAILLAGRGGGELNSQELSILLADEKTDTVSNRLLHAILLTRYGDRKQQDDAAAMLRQLVSENNQKSDDARRVLVGLLRRQFEESDEAEDTVVGERFVNEILDISATLSKRPAPVPTDVYRHADFLLSLEDDSRLADVRRLAEKLTYGNGGLMQSLDIKLRYSERTAPQSSVPAMVEEWLRERAAEDGELNPNALATAGVRLLKAGFAEEGLQWIEKGYSLEPEARLRGYVIALSSEGKYEKVVEICRKHYDEFKDVLSVTLLAEALMIDPERIDEAVNRVLEDAISRFDTDASFIESIATLRMLQNDYAKAIPLFQKVLTTDPFRIRTLNNLSMAYSQITERATDGLATINRAIKLAGEVPELLDTKGTVLLTMGRLDEAHELFSELVATSSEPRYRFHLIITLLAQEKVGEAKNAWKELNLKELDAEGLTPAERLRLEQLKIDFAPTPQTS
ncbi:MAG: hypothetical protein ACPGLY_10350 [Rubripirellula sp.]